VTIEAEILFGGRKHQKESEEVKEKTGERSIERERRTHFVATQIDIHDENFKSFFFFFFEISPIIFPGFFFLCVPISMDDGRRSPAHVIDIPVSERTCRICLEPATDAVPFLRDPCNVRL
jgi:hypothetical protein